MTTFVSCAPSFGFSDTGAIPKKFLLPYATMNANPTVSEASGERLELLFRDGWLDDMTNETVFEVIRDIQDPEHPYTLEKLSVVKPEYIQVGTIVAESDELRYRGLPLKHVSVFFRPTIPHCSMAGVIGLAIKYQLSRYIRPEYWIRVFVLDDTHVNWKALNKQLNDRDRVMAALENESMTEMLDSIVPTLHPPQPST